jgi:hypothetical protein
MNNSTENAALLASQPTYMGQPANRGAIKIEPAYPGEGIAVIKCGGTTVEVGYTMLDFFAQTALPWAPMGENHPDYPKWAALRNALHSIVCEAAEGGRAGQ